MARGPRKQRLNLFLLKVDVPIDEAVRNDLPGVESFTISDEFPFAGAIWISASESHLPPWYRFVQSGTRTTLSGIFAQSSSALITLQAAGRVFCVAFGSARHWIKDENIERRFGMITTLNVVHPDKIRSVDREEFDTVTRMTRSQTSVSSSIDNFGLDVRRDLVRSVTGEPADKQFAAHVTGADNLILHAALDFGQLADKCVQTLEHFQKTTYKDRYGWIDNFLRVRDPLLINTLERGLADAIQTGSVENIFLSPPILMDTQEHHGFRYPGERIRSDAHMDLRLDEFMTGRDPHQMSIDWLKQHKIREYTSDTDAPSREFTIFEAIVYEVRAGNKLYVLSQGEWFEIDQDHVQAVSAEVAAIDEHNELRLPDALPDEHEATYNERAARESNGLFALLDRQQVQYGGGRSTIEVCDLISSDRNFIHVKAKTKSSALSHLFAQGLNSAQAIRDARFRQLASEVCPETHRHIFQQEDFRVSDHDVTFAIITRAPNAIGDALPFFSKQSLANAARELRNMGYRVWIRKIPIMPAS